MSGSAGYNSKDFSRDEEIVSTDLRMAESICTEWTNEKHSLYLNSMEASFVRQLYNHEYRSIDLLDWSSRRKNPLNPNSSQQLSANTHISSGQFKVIQSGCWKKLNFERAQPRSDLPDQSHVLPANPWIQHFKSVRKRQELTISNLQENGANCNKSIRLGYQSTGSKEFTAYHSHLGRQDSVCSNEEVSGQNFVDEEHEEEQLSSLRKSKRMKMEVTDVSSNDQVVPIGKSTTMIAAADLSENCFSPNKLNVIHTIRKSENMDGFANFVEQEQNEHSDDAR